jgi:selenocysteine lyase/cysteine desulfurase
VGVLFVNKNMKSRLWPSIVSAGSGPIGISKEIEGYGQRDEPAIMAFTEALKFQTQIGRKNIEKRSRELSQQLMAGLSKIDGLKIVTHRDPMLSAAVVRFQHPMDGQKLNAALYQRDKLAFAGGGNSVRVSPHFYNLPEEIDRTVAAIKRYMSGGLGTAAL